MPKKDVLRRIDHRDPKIKVKLPEPGWRIKEERDWDIPASVGVSKNYAREDHTHGTPEKPYELAGSGGGLTLATCSVWGDLVNGDLSTVLTNLADSALAYDQIKASCEPAAPTGGIGVTLTVGGTVLTELVIAAAAKSTGTTAVAAGSWAVGAAMSAAITTLAGTYTGTVTVMLGKAAA